MTLTALLPSLRTSIPDPLDCRRWPAGTLATTTDVIVAGESLLNSAILSGTPCSVSGCASVPAASTQATSGQLRRSASLSTAVNVFSVLSVDSDEAGLTLVHVDGSLEHLDSVWPETRLIGRASTARARAAKLGVGPSESAHYVAVILPGDLRAGDLLAVPAAPAEAYLPALVLPAGIATAIS